MKFRHVVAALLGSGAGFALLSSAALGWPKTCTDVVAYQGSQALVEKCDVVGLNYGPVIVLLATAVIVILPDLEEIDLFGTIKLKRKVEAVETDVAHLRLAVSQKVTQSQNLYVSRDLPPNVDLKPYVENIDRKSSVLNEAEGES
jgi:hypothetical protein